MNSPVTLHDFVLNLISDADARTAFQLDPDGVLDAAGLSDVTPADVHDAIPLVFDYAPARVAGLSSGLSDLTSATLDRTGALNQLQSVTGQVTGNGLSTRDLTLTAAGSLSGAAGLTGPAGHADLTGGFSGGTGPVGLTGGIGGAGTGSHPVDDGDHGFSASHDPDSALDAHTTTDAHLTGSLTGTAGSLTSTVDDLTHHTLHTVTGTVDTAHGLVGDLTGGALSPATDLLHGGLVPDTGLLHGTDPLHGTGLLHGGLVPDTGLLGLGGSADASGGAQASTDGHLTDLTHLF